MHFSKLFPFQSSILLEGFWASSNWKYKYAKVSLPSTMEVVDLENLVVHPYCGPKNLKAFSAYTLFEDFNNGDFVS